MVLYVCYLCIHTAVISHLPLCMGDKMIQMDRLLDQQSPLYGACGQHVSVSHSICNLAAVHKLTFL